MATVFVYHVVGDLTVGKPELVEFSETETVESAIRALSDCTECAIPVWKKKQSKNLKGLPESGESKQQRFVGIVNSMDIVAFLARESSLVDHESALRMPVSVVVEPNPSLLRCVDPGTRLIDALEMMKQGVRRLLVPRSVAWKGMSKRFSMIYNVKWLKNLETLGSNSNLNTNCLPSATSETNWCCLSREDLLRFIIGCLGALAPLPLTPISSLNAITSTFNSIDASSSAVEAIQSRYHDPSAVSVVETLADGNLKILGEISASKLWKCDYISAAWALAKLSAGEFVMGVEGQHSMPDQSVLKNGEVESHVGDSSRPKKKFSSRSLGFSNLHANQGLGVVRSMYRGRSTPLVCKTSNSLAAVLAQMLSHRATHVWVTDEDEDGVLVGIVTYTDIICAVTRQQPPSIPPPPM